LRYNSVLCAVCCVVCAVCVCLCVCVFVLCVCVCVCVCRRSGVKAVLFLTETHVQ